MPRKLRPTATITSSDSRLKLPWRRAPYGFTSIAPGLRLGYRRVKDKQEAGRWVLKEADGKGDDKRSVVGTADDFEAADGVHIFDFWQAADKARQMARGTTDTGAPATWAQAIENYEADLKARGGSRFNARQVFNHLTAHAPALLDKPVALLTAAELTRWRNALVASHLKPSSTTRILKSAKAVLNLAANHDTRITNRNAWRVGLGGLQDGYEPINKVLPDSTVRRIMIEADALDPEFGAFVAVCAETGCRASQAAKLEVADLHVDTLSMPCSKKGKRNRAIVRTPVPISRELAARLKRAAHGRDLGAPLLLRADGGAWRPENKCHLQKPFAIVVKRAGIEGTTMYALRHSSIVRSLLANVPTRLTAATHDTSVTMLERVYSRFVSHAGADLARRGLLAATGDVVSLKKRRA
jgi:integrase